MFKLKKDQFRLICYLIVFCAIASFPVRQILAFEYPEIPPKEYFFETEIYDLRRILSNGLSRLPSASDHNVQ